MGAPASSTSCSQQEEPVIQPSSLAKGLQPPTGAWCHVLRASSASTAPWGWQWGRICCSAVSEAEAGCVPLGSLGKGCSGCLLTVELESNLAWSRGKSSQERLYNPNQPARGVCAPEARAVPLWMWLGRSMPCLWDRTCPRTAAPLPVSPLHACLGPPALSEPGGFVIQNALGQLCFGLKLQHSNFFFHFISGRALELCSLPLPPSSPPAELLPGPVSFPGAPSCSLLLFNPHFFCPLSPSVLLPRRQITNHKLCYSSNRS